MFERLGKTSGRIGHWLRYTLRPPDVSFVHHPAYTHAVGGGLMDASRSAKILGFLTDEQLIRRHDVSRPLPASLENILRVHTPEYLETLSDPAVVSEILGVPLSEREAQQALDMVRLMTGGTIQATRLALRTRKVAVNLAGGFHHAAPDRGMGFCVFNDVAVAILRLRARGFDEPVLVVDLDLHDGNGTRAVFVDDPTVYTYSIHNAPWDEAEATASTSIVLGSDVGDDTFLATLRDTLPQIVSEHKPGLVVYVAGVDGAAGDAVGDWRLSAQALLERDRFVVELTRNGRQRVPLVVLLAGGYGTAAWRYSARFFGWLVSGSVVEPPDDAELLLRRFREISQRWNLARTGPRDSADWELEREDILGALTHEDTRFLGQFPRHAVELQMEQLGLLDSIRARGFQSLTVTLTAPQGLGQTLRVFADPEGKELLMELKASRSRSMVPGHEVIEIEWLLMQDARSSFTESRPQLPGQRHPGLGLLREVAVWMVVVCERLRLDGIAFVPSQFYMAAVGRRHLKFVEPAARARFEALRDAVAGADLAHANRAINEGCVVDEATGESAYWEPAPMVVPVSEQLQQRLASGEYRGAVRAARERLDYRLRPALSSG
jgi:acetoin utilization deacetylase AcuC-like enzyme